MKSLKSKGKQSSRVAPSGQHTDQLTASRFFKDVPSQDEKVANAVADDSIDFDAGIQGRSMKSKRKIRVAA
jgi:hypothetical protein